MAGGTLPPVIGELKLSIDDFISKLQEAKEALTQLAASEAEPTVTADTDEAQEKLEDVRSSVDDLDDAHADPSVGADTGDAEAKIEDVQGEVDELDAAHADPTIGVDDADANAKIEEVKAEIAEIEATHADAHVGVDTGGSESKIGDMTAKMLTFGAVAPAAAAMAGGAFAALPGILSGASAGFGSLFLGIQNITAALSAYKSATDSAGQIGNEMAQQQLSAAQTLTNAAEQVASAQIQLSQAQVQAYDSIHQAEEQVVQSSQQLEEAQSAQRQAQVSLTEAIMQAQFQLQDYKQQMADMALQVQQAQLNIKQSKLTMDETLGDPAATELQRQQATLAYKEAVQQLSDLDVQYKQLQETVAYQSAKGVSGADNVVSAQQQVKSANYQVIDAQQAQSDAAMYLSQAQVSSAQQVQEAEMQLTQAIQNQGFAIKETALELAQPVGALSQLQTALAALSPAGQQFVEWWHSAMTPVLQSIYASDQASLLTGLEPSLEKLMPYFADLSKALDASAQGFDGFFAKIAGFLSSAQGLSEFTKTMQSGLGFMNDMGSAILTVMKAMGQLGVIGAPAVQAIGHAIDLAADAFLRWTQSAGAKDLIGVFTSLMPVIENVLHELGGFGSIGLIAFLTKTEDPLRLLIAFIPQLMPLAVPFVKLAGAILDIGKVALGPIVSALAHGLASIMTAVEPVVSAIRPLAGLLGQTLAGAVRDLMPLVLAIAKALGPLLEPIVRALGPVVEAAGKVLEAFARALAPLEPVIGKLAAAVGGALGQAMIVLAPIIANLAPVIVLVTDALVEIIKVLAPFAPEILVVVGAIVLMSSPVAQLGLAISGLTIVVRYLAEHWKGIWDEIKHVVDDVWNFLDGLLHNTAVQIIMAPVAPLLDLLMHWNTVWSTIQTAAEDVWHFLDGDVFQPLAAFFTDTLGAAVSGLSSIWSTQWDIIQTVITDVWNVIKPIFDGLSHAISDVGNAIGTISHAGGGILGDIMGAVGLGGGSNVKRGAEGGYVGHPTLALIGEAGPELLLPLNNPARMAELLASAPPLPNAGGMGAAGRGGMGQQVNVYANTSASAQEIAQEVSWAMRQVTAA